MGKIWIHIETVVSPDGSEAKALLTDSLKEMVNKSLIERIVVALPEDKFSTAARDKPIKVTDAYNAIKVVARLTLKVETQGSKMTVGTTLRLDFEAIRAPNTTGGNLLSTASKGASVENRGTGERAAARNVDDVLDAIVAPLVKQVLTNPNFKSYGSKLGLPL